MAIPPLALGREMSLGCVGEERTHRARRKQWVSDKPTILCSNRCSFESQGRHPFYSLNV